METFADPVRLEMPGLRAGIINVRDRERQCILVSFGCASVFRAAIREHSIQRDLVLLEEWQHMLIEQVRGCYRCFPVRKFREPHLAVAVYEGLLVAPADALQGPDIERVLCAAVARTFALKFVMRFFVGLRLLQRKDLRLGQHEALLRHLCLQGLEPFPHGFQIMLSQMHRTPAGEIVGAR